MALIVAGRRCPVHALARERARPNVTVRHWYHLTAWRRLRRQVIDEQAHACAICARVVAELEVDHVRKHDGDRAAFFDRANLQALCKPCHSQKTQRGE